MSISIKQIKGEPNLVRDMRSTAVINTNVKDLQAARKRLEVRKDQKEIIDNLSEQVSGIKSDINAIKEMMQQLAAK